MPPFAFIPAPSNKKSAWIPDCAGMPTVHRVYFEDEENEAWIATLGTFARDDGGALSVVITRKVSDVAIHAHTFTSVSGNEKQPRSPNTRE